MPHPLLDLNVPTPPDTEDEIDDDIDFTISDSQLVEGNDVLLDRETEPFIEFRATDCRIVNSTSDGNDDSDIDFTLGNDTVVNRETEPFVDFTINDSKVARVVDTEDGME